MGISWDKGFQTCENPGQLLTREMATLLLDKLQKNQRATPVLMSGCIPMEDQHKTGRQAV